MLYGQLNILVITYDNSIDNILTWKLIFNLFSFLPDVFRASFLRKQVLINLTLIEFSQLLCYSCRNTNHHLRFDLLVDILFCFNPCLELLFWIVLSVLIILYLLKMHKSFIISLEVLVFNSFLNFFGMFMRSFSCPKSHFFFDKLFFDNLLFILLRCLLILEISWVKDYLIITFIIICINFYDFWFSKHYIWIC